MERLPRSAVRLAIGYCQGRCCDLQASELVMPAILLLVTQLGGCGFYSGDAAAESIELVEDNQTPADALPLGGPTTVDRPKLTSVPIPTLASRNPPDTTTTTTTTAAPITPADAPPAPVPSMPQTPQAPQPPATNPQTAATTPAPIPEIVPIPVTPTSASPRTTQ